VVNQLFLEFHILFWPDKLHMKDIDQSKIFQLDFYPSKKIEKIIQYV